MADEAPGEESPGAAPSFKAARGDDGGATRASRAAAAVTRRRRPDHDPHEEGRLKRMLEAWEANLPQAESINKLLVRLSRSARCMQPRDDRHVVTPTLRGDVKKKVMATVHKQSDATSR